MKRSALVAEISISPMKKRHLTQVLRIEAKVYPRPWSLGIFLSELNLPESRYYYVAQVRRKVVGYCGLMVAVGEGHITNVAVDPEFWGVKVATRLLLNAFEVAKQSGAKDMTLEVRASNTRAQKLYFRFGFVPVGIRKGYYKENNEDAIVMWSYNIDTEIFEQRLAEIRQGLNEGEVNLD
ncbi:[SSU ribosomal protein S18P]-alanine acetyltransferase [Ferrithrix thermotolerans DSM 19514]|uniref:[SSU ribosomal protein S18P]-alanine acetyltransferase n=1 Tax=Ferrithrix thermotolerans DSM 19514 TaxID=1121881 RepID=A0A1M4SV86_9ACTN|nr:ribosomal protein S18-alanine N-acetyltransferase [Ferrithrix thermotolerans]SHE36115.1 [SSU ribosomal protein S18P]-alanine acetyltransferase [Ferrithrix thermotolerans DSM 19514]